MPSYIRKTETSLIFLKGELGEPCSDCGWVTDYLCDFPVGEDKTCDRRLCEDHAHRVSDDIHYCETHFKMWDNFTKGKKLGAVLPAKVIEMNNVT